MTKTNYYKQLAHKLQGKVAAMGAYRLTYILTLKSAGLKQRFILQKYI